MYELEQINPKIVKNYFEAIAKINTTKKPYLILCSMIKSAFHLMAPNCPNRILEPYVKKALEPFRIKLESEYKIRPFISHEEAIQIYNSIEKELNIEECEEKNELYELANYFYDLLEYDICEEEYNQTFLHSFSKIYISANQHLNALRKWNKLDKNKLDEHNYDIARNTNTTYAKMVAFKLKSIQLELDNPLTIDKCYLLFQKDTLKDFTKYNHITARAIKQILLIKDDVPNEKYVQANVNLSHIINADKPIEKIEIYRSFYTSIFGIYRFSSKINKKEPPHKELYIFAKKLSEFVFPELKKLKKPLFTKNKTKKPINETCIFNGLSLISFEDGRNKIKKEQDEIDFTEQYLKIVTKSALKFYHLSKS